jgi:hypothetical protein
VRSQPLSITAPLEPRDLRIAISSNNLADIYCSSNHYVAAEPLYILNNRAVWAISRGKYRAAEIQPLPLLEIYATVLRKNRRATQAREVAGSCYPCRTGVPYLRSTGSSLARARFDASVSPDLIMGFFSC